MSSILPHRVMCASVFVFFLCHSTLFTCILLLQHNWICSWNFHLLKCTHSSIGNTTSNSIIAEQYANAVHSVWWMGIDYYYLNAHRCKYSRASKSSFREANGNWHFLSVIVHVCNILYSLRNETKSNTMSPYGRNSFTPL